MLSCTSQTCTGAEQRKRAKPGHNKNAPHCCEAFGAENETCQMQAPIMGGTGLFNFGLFNLA
jgi:hypothetical protein